MTPPPRDRRIPAILLALCAAALFIRFYKLNERGLWLDEIDLWLCALTPRRSSQLAPLPIYLHKAWLWFTGSRAPFAFHIPSALLGAAAIFPTYWLGKTLRDRSTGLLAAALLTFSPLAIYYSQEARPYALLQFLAPLLIVLFIRAWRSDEDPRWWAAYGAVLALTLLTHMNGALIGAGFGLWALGELASFRRWKTFFVFCGVSAVASLIGLFWITGRSRPTAPLEGFYHGPLLTYAREVFHSLGVTYWRPKAGGLGRDIFALVFFALAALGCRSTREAWETRRLGSLGALILAVSVVTVYANLGGKDSWPWLRYLIHVLPLYLALVAAGVMSAMRNKPAAWRGVAAAAVLLMLAPGVFEWAAFQTGSRYPKSQELGRWLRENPGRVDAVAVLVPARLRIFLPVATYAAEMPPSVRVFGFKEPYVGRIFTDIHPDWPAAVAQDIRRRLPAGRYAVIEWENFRKPFDQRLNRFRGVTTAVEDVAQRTPWGLRVYDINRT